MTPTLGCRPRLEVLGRDVLVGIRRNSVISFKQVGGWEAEKGFHSGSYHDGIK